MKTLSHLLDRPSGPLKVRAFLYYLVTYLPIALIGTASFFIGNYIIKGPSKDIFQYFIGGGAIIFGICLFLVSLIEPFLKLIYFDEAINSPSNFSKVDVSTHSKESAVGVEISSHYDIKKIADEIIDNECKILGRPYCIKIARKSGLNIDESGKVKDLSEDAFSDIEKVVGVYVDAFGKPALYAAQVVLAKYPEIKSTSIYKQL
jgi:hypothetical protein